jgi:hypothetical protein
MAWPTPQDYNEAVQNPLIAFTDPELRTSQAATNHLGLPQAISGGFATVYRMISGSRVWAARCFTTETTDQQDRYAAIERHLKASKLPYMVPFSYQANGIRVGGQAYPLLKMQWMKGDGLAEYVSKNLSNPATLSGLAEKWKIMIRSLQDANIAHGDLQHGNVLVVNSDICLLDYDGMFVPDLSGRFSNEVGHRNFQHPQRTNLDYGPYLDNFAAWVIYVSLVALSERPELYQRFNGGDEALLFRRDDFLNPRQSPLFAEVGASGNSNLRQLSEFLARLSTLSLLDVPALDVTYTSNPNVSLGQMTLVAADWWQDHIDTSSVENGEVGADDGSDLIPDFTWIKADIVGKPLVQPVCFQSSLRGIRVVTAGSITAICVAGLCAGMPPFGVVGMSASVVLLLVVFYLSLYNSDRTVEELKAFQRGLHQIKQSSQEQRRILKEVAQGRAKTRASARAARTLWGQKRRAAELELHSTMSSTQEGLTAAISLFDQQKRQFTETEGAEMRRVQGKYSDQLADLGRKIASLDRQEAEEKDRALTALRKTDVEVRLRGFRIEEATIPGIGPSYRRGLVRNGVHSAADLFSGTHRSVEGIGPKRAESLERWRDELKRVAELHAPRTLPPAHAAQISASINQQRSALSTAKAHLESQLRTAVAELRNRYASERQKLVNDEKQKRDSATVAIANARRACFQKLQTLDKEFELAKSQAESDLEAITTRTKNEASKVAILDMQIKEKIQDGQRFSQISFTRFLLLACGLGRT